MSAKQTPESFWARVDVRGLGECWLWRGHVNRFGYGHVKWHRKLRGAHRIAAWLVGLVPSVDAPADKRGWGFVLHACDNKRCCNPTHFEIGTYAKNQRDAYDRLIRRRVGGERHHAAKLNRAVVEVLRADAGATPQTRWAALLGVSQQTISRALGGRTWTY